MSKATLMEKLQDKGFDAIDIHYFMLRHDLGHCIIGILSDDQKADMKYNISMAHAEIDHTPHK
jgi:hypothetical protein